MPADPPLSLTLFGPLTLVVGGDDVRPTPGRTQQGRFLLGLLTLRAIRGEGWIERDQAASLVWPPEAGHLDELESGERDSRVRARLRTALSDLRATLGRERDRLWTKGTRIRLDLTDAEVDVRRFDAAVAGLRGRQAVSTAATLNECAEAVRLHAAGTLLEGCVQDWVTPERAWREAAYIRALRLLIADANARGDDLSANGYQIQMLAALREAVARAPRNQAAVRALVQAQTNAGERSGARQTFAELRERLEGRWESLEPETRALYDEIERAADTAEDASRRGTGDRDGRGGIALAGPIAPPHNLPHPVSRLIGRVKEADLIAAWLREARLVTLVGCGGIGKTRLAVDVSHRSLPHYPDGVWFVDLSDTADDGEVYRAILHALPHMSPSVAALGSASPLLAVRTWLRDRSALLILDNCEQVIDASAQAVSALLRDCPNLTVLATSRERLRVTGETVCTVPPLDVPTETGHEADGESLMDGGSAAAALALFLERLRQSGVVHEGAPLTPQESQAAADICRRLEGIPLALELAAARVDRPSHLPEVARRLTAEYASWLPLLKEGARDAPERHRTMEACLQWSYELLLPSEQTLLQALAVFSGGGTQQAVEAVWEGAASAPETKDALKRLVRLSLAMEEPGPEGNAWSPRFRLLEPVRQFALARVGATGQESAVRRRHRDYYLEWAIQAEPGVAEDVPTRQAALRLLDAERDDLRSAFLACAEDITGTAARLARAQGVWRNWSRQNFCNNEAGQRWLNRLLQKTPGALPDPSRHAQALLLVGRLLIATPAYQMAHTVFARGLEAARAAGDEATAAHLILMQGHMAVDVRDWPNAKRYCESAREVFVRLGDVHGEARTSHYLCDIAIEEGDMITARQLSAQMLRTAAANIIPECAAAADQDRLGNALYRRARVAEAEADWREAAARHHEALLLFERLGNRSAAILCLNGIARALLGQGDTREAVTLFAGIAAMSERLCCGENYIERHNALVSNARLSLGEMAARAAALEGAGMDWHELIARAGKMVGGAAAPAR